MDFLFYTLDKLIRAVFHRIFRSRPMEARLFNPAKLVKESLSVILRVPPMDVRFSSPVRLVRNGFEYQPPDTHRGTDV